MYNRVRRREWTPALWPGGLGSGGPGASSVDTWSPWSLSGCWQRKWAVAAGRAAVPLGLGLLDPGLWFFFVFLDFPCLDHKQVAKSISRSSRPGQCASGRGERGVTGPLPGTICALLTLVLVPSYPPCRGEEGETGHVRAPACSLAALERTRCSRLPTQQQRPSPGPGGQF